MNIKKIKMTSGVTTIDYIKEGNVMVTETSKTVPHPDFVDKLNAFKQAFVHSLDIDRVYEDIKISGFEVKEHKSGDTITITGSFKDRTGNFIGVACRPISFDDDNYQEWDLFDMSSKAIAEAIMFLKEGKNAQIEMDFPDENYDES
jgi:hypothetical protein